MAINNNPIGGSPYKFEGKPDAKVDKAAGEKLDLDGNHTIDKEEQEIAQVAGGKDAIVIDKSTNTITLSKSAEEPMAKAQDLKKGLGEIGASPDCKAPVEGAKLGNYVTKLEDKLTKIYGPDKAKAIIAKLEDTPGKMEELQKMLNAVPPNTSAILKNCLLAMKGDGSGC